VALLLPAAAETKTSTSQVSVISKLANGTFNSCIWIIGKIMNRTDLKIEDDLIIMIK